MNQDTLAASFGADQAAFRSSMQIGLEAGLMTQNRVRGRDIIASPLYFSGNLEGLLDIAARGDAPSVQKLLLLISKNQGLPLSSIIKEASLGGTPLSADELSLLQGLAQEGIIKPPSIIRPNNKEEHFIFCSGARKGQTEHSKSRNI